MKILLISIISAIMILSNCEMKDIELPDNNYINIGEKSIHKSEITTTEFDFITLGVTSDDNVSEIKYERFVYDNGEIVPATSDSPFFKQSGTDVVWNDRREHGYIPIYELQDGLNIIKVSEKYLDGTVDVNEHYIEKVESEYDKLYTERNVEKTKELSLTTYQDELKINMNDYINFLLTGSYYTPNEIVSVEYVIYERPLFVPGEIIDDEESSKEYLNSWIEIQEYGARYDKVARLYGNYWAINLGVASIRKSGTKVDIIATDSAGNKVVKSVYLYDSSDNESIIDRQPIDESEINEDGTVNNRINIWFEDNVNQKRCQEIINEIDGTIVGGALSIKSYSVKLNNKKFDSDEEFESYCEKLKNKYYEIESVYPEVVVYYNENDYILD